MSFSFEQQSGLLPTNEKTRGVARDGRVGSADQQVNTHFMAEHEIESLGKPDFDAKLASREEEVCTDEETRSLSAHGPSLTHLFSANVTSNLFGEIGSSSLLVESSRTPSGLFSQGDRFIPCRASESDYFQGAIKFSHEENLLLSRQAKKETRRRRDSSANSNMSGQSRSRSRDSTQSTESNSGSSGHVTHASRQQRLNYESIIHEGCFGPSEEPLSD